MPVEQVDPPRADRPDSVGHQSADINIAVFDAFRSRSIGEPPLRHARTILRRRLGPLAILMLALPTGCAASEKAAYVSHLEQSIHRTTARDAHLAAAFGLDEPGAPVLAGADTGGAWGE